MKLDTNQLKTALTHAYKAILKKPIIPVLSCFILTNKDTAGEFHVMTTDMNLFIDEHLPCAKDEDIHVAVPADELMKFISKIKSDTVELIVQQEKMIVKTKEGKVTMPLLNTSDFPSYPSGFGEEVYFVDSAPFLSAIQSVPFFSPDHSRGPIAAIHFDFNGEFVKIESSDGYRAGLHSIECESEFAEFMIMGDQIKQVVSILNSSSGEDVTLSQTNGYVKFVSGKTTVIARVVSGKYPMLQKLFPKEFKHTLMFDVDNFIDLIETASIFSDVQSRQITVELKPAFLSVVTSSQKGSIESEPIDISRLDSSEDPPDCRVSFNTQFLIPVLKQLSSFGNEIALKYVASNKPIVFESISNKNYTSMIMPVVNPN
jgi:DNA polymerase III beta subunit